MRITIIALLGLLLAFVAPVMWEKVMDAAPELAWRILFLVFALGAIAWVLLSDPIFVRLTNPNVYRWSSLVILVMTGGAIFGSTWWFLVVQRPEVARLEVVATTTAARVEGDVFKGITWSDRFSPLEIIIKNPLSKDLVDMDLNILPDQAVVEAIQVSHIQDVRIEPSLQIRPSVEVVNRVTKARVLSPIILVATNGGYGVKVSRLMRRETLELLMAIGDVDHLNPKVNMDQPGGTISFPMLDGRANFYIRPEITRDRSLAFKANKVLAKNLNIGGTFVLGKREIRWDHQVQIQDIVGDVLAKH